MLGYLACVLLGGAASALAGWLHARHQRAEHRDALASEEAEHEIELYRRDLELAELRKLYAGLEQRGQVLHAWFGEEASRAWSGSMHERLALMGQEQVEDIQFQVAKARSKLEDR